MEKLTIVSSSPDLTPNGRSASEILNKPINYPKKADPRLTWLTEVAHYYEASLAADADPEHFKRILKSFTEEYANSSKPPYYRSPLAWYDISTFKDFAKPPKEDGNKPKGDNSIDYIDLMVVTTMMLDDSWDPEESLINALPNIHPEYIVNSSKKIVDLWKNFQKTLDQRSTDEKVLDLDTVLRETSNMSEELGNRYALTQSFLHLLMARSVRDIASLRNLSNADYEAAMKEAQKALHEANDYVNKFCEGHKEIAYKRGPDNHSRVAAVEGLTQEILYFKGEYTKEINGIKNRNNPIFQNAA